MSYGWSSYYYPKSDDVAKTYNTVLKLHEGRLYPYGELELENLRNELSIYFMNTCGELPAFELDEYGFITEVKGEKIPNA